jgi:ABC-type sugar transport system ATPase subunit
MPTVKSVSTPAEFSRARSPPIYRSSSLQRSSWSSISRPPRRLAHQAGIVLVHQEGAAVDQLSIGENVMLTLEPNQYGIIAWPALHERAASALGQLGVSADTQQRLGEHGGVALTELIEIARSIVRGGSVFVFDESTAALGVEEIGNLLQRMRELARSGASVIFISHRIQEILSICDRVVVIRDGRKVLDAPRAELDHATVVAAMLAGIANRQSSGRLAESPHLNDHTSPGALLQLKNWRRPRSERSRVDLGPINLEIGRGEIFGIFGPLGAGKTELLESLFGLSESLRRQIPANGFCLLERDMEHRQAWCRKA